MPPTQRRAPRTRRSSQEVRRLLLGAAQDVVSREGVDRAMVATIAEQAGVTVSALYRHFGSREEMVQEAIRAAFGDFLDRWRDALPPVACASEDGALLTVYIRTLYTVAREKRGLLQTVLVEKAQGDGLVPARLAPLLTELFGDLDDISREHARAQGMDEAKMSAGLHAVSALTLVAALIGPGFAGTSTHEELITFLVSFSTHGARRH